MRLVLWFLIILGSMAPPAPLSEDPIAIPQGNDLAEFDLVGIGPNSITRSAGEIRLTGQPMGYFATHREFRNFDLAFEWKYDRPDGLRSDSDFRGNSGLLLHLKKPHKVWPACIQVQLAQADPGSIFSMGGSSCQTQVDTNAQKAAIRPVGQWNRTEVHCRDGAISCLLNGSEVARGQGAQPDQGVIAWQSEGQPIRFRSIRIKTLP